MEHSLTRHLNDHLVGSSGDLLLIQKLVDSHDASEAREFFISLEENFEADRSILKDLLVRLGQNPCAFLQVAGGIAVRHGGMNRKREQLESATQGKFEAFEMLALGVHGKCLLWVALREIAPWLAEWNGIDFMELELQAIQQRDHIEFWRLQAATEIPAAEEIRNGNTHAAA